MDQMKKLSNGVFMPRVGLGTWKMSEEEAEASVEMGLSAGYRAIDTASIYRNEAGVGRALAKTVIPREQLFITTKVYNDEQGYRETLEAFERSLEKLQLTYVDLYLIHWPVVSHYHKTWQALEELYRAGRVRAIGVSNFHQQHLADLMTTATIKPMINQIECHPYLNQQLLIDYCQQSEIAVTAYSPLGHGQLLSDPQLQLIADKYHKTTAQVALRWALQRDVLVIPKTIHPERLAENIALFDFQLDDDDMQQINRLNRNQRMNKDPNLFVVPNQNKK